MMNNENFNLKSVVDFLEENGFHVIEARENFSNNRNPKHSIVVEICVPRRKKTFLLRGAVDFITTSGLSVIHAVEYYRGKKFPVSIGLEISTVYPAC
jgi:DUF1009 family protein